jgi:hypothetical protein
VVDVTTPADGIDERRLAWLPKEVRENPLFRQGYRLGWTNRGFEEADADWAAGRRALQQVDDQPTTRRYSVEAFGLARDLRVGDQAVRETTGRKGIGWLTEVPCCGRTVVISEPDDDGESGTVICCHCRISYLAAACDEELDGFSDTPTKVGVFTVNGLGLAIASHRTGKWEPK